MSLMEARSFYTVLYNDTQLKDFERYIVFSALIMKGLQNAECYHDGIGGGEFCWIELLNCSIQFFDFAPRYQCNFFQ